MPLSKKDLEYKRVVEGITKKVPALASSFESAEYTKQVILALRRNSFFVSQLHKVSTINYMKSSLARAVEKGQGFKGWKEQIRNSKQFKKDLKSISDARLKLVYRQNVGQAQTDGVFDGAKELGQYLTFSSVNDDRTRPSHSELDGITLPADHPFWLEHRPLLDFGCRCDLLHTDKALAKKTHEATVKKKIKAFQKKGGALKGFAKNTTQDQKAISKYLNKRAKQTGISNDTIKRLDKSNKQKSDIFAEKVLRSIKGN